MSISHVNTNKTQNFLPVAYLGFQKGGEAPRWGARERSGEGAVPPQKKKSFYVPKIIIFGAF